MSEHPRISELTGMRTQAEEAEAVWPLNVVLGILGAAILGVAFSFLDTQDTRPLYNPWTYAIATPLALIVLQVLLSLVVSRLIEKSMQMAFLLSVLVHLVLLVGAMNVVVFSRMWPDVLDSLAQHREQLKRENLQAKQYHRISSTSQTGRRPDYLKPVETEHQPTEIEEVQSPALVLARSQRANLASPSPKVQLSHTPHLMERDRTAATLPSSAPQAASLSRSTVARQQPPTREPAADAQEFDESQPTPLGPSEASLNRRNAQQSQLPSLEFSRELPVEERTERNLSNANSRSLPAQPRALAAKPPAPASLNRRRLETDPPTVRLPQSLASAEALESPARVAPVAPREAESRRRSQDVRQISPQVALLPAPPASPKQSSSPLASVLPRREVREQSPLPPSSDAAVVWSRDSAGGRTGLAAPSSLPVRGVEDFGAVEPPQASDQRVAKSDITKRRTGDSRAVARLPNIGGPQSSTWNGVPSLAQGAMGRSPSQLAEEASDGDAASRDNAGLTGSGQAIERAAMGRTGLVGPISPPVVDSYAAEHDQLAANSLSNAELSAEAATIKRERAGGENAQSLQIHELLARSLESGLPTTTTSEMKRVEDAAPWPGPSEKQPSASGIFQRNDALAAAGSVPSKSVIEIQPADTLMDPSHESRLDGNGQASGLRRSQPQGRASGSWAPTTLLEIEQPIGAGGIASGLGQVGALLNRRDAPLNEWSPPQLESQRFARQDVGGRLAGGQEIALPKPAFQQRLDRLQDRNPQDESSLEPQTELAIERGLAFLAKHQRSDGSWRLQDLDPQVLMRSDTAATGLALLAFQGAGYTHNQFKYQRTVDRAVQFLVKHQRSDGDLYIPQDPASDQNAWLYSHAIATLAMCEAVGMTQDEQLRPAAQRAIDFMVASQDPLRGGWRYRPGNGSDTSVTGWFMMAFKSGQLAGLEVPPKAFGLIEKFLNESQANQPFLYRYNPFASDTPQQRHGLQPTSVMTSVGLLMRLYMGWQRERSEMMAGTDYLLEHLPEHGSATVSRRDTYYWYYATQVMFHMRGERWQKWHDRLYPLLINSQITEGEMEGSWDPNYPTPDLWARYGGRHYVTTMNLLSLEVSYRHLPLYEATAK